MKKNKKVFYNYTFYVDSKEYIIKEENPTKAREKLVKLLKNKK